MKPTQLIISGWGSYPDKVTVDFKKFYEGGLFLITGPTGAGKTTIFDAISFALYGDVSGKVREKTTVRSDFASPIIDTYVELTFTHKGENYRILRSPKYERPKKRGEGFTVSAETAELYLENDSPIVSVSEVNRKIERVMGINYVQFKQIAMIAQGEFLELLLSSSKERVEILRNLFKTNHYDRLQRLIAEKAKGLYVLIQEQKNKIEEAIHNIDAGDKEDLRTCLEATNFHYEKILDLTKESIKEDKKTLLALEEELGVFGEQIKELIKDVTEGEQRNSLIQKFDKVLDNLKLKKEEQPLILEEEEILKKATLAEKVKVEERIYLEELEREANLVSKLQGFRDELEILEPEYERRKASLEENLKNEEVTGQLHAEYMQLEGYLPLLEKLQELKISLLKVQKKVSDYEEKEAFLIKEEEDKTKYKIRLLEEIESYSDLEKHIGENALHIATAKEQEKKYQEVLNLVDKLSDEMEQLASHQKEYERISNELKEEKQLYEEKEEIYRNAMVGIVAKLVKDNEPCPVCGSLEHPHVVKVSEEVPEEQELEKLAKLVEEKTIQYDKIYQDTARRKAEVESKEDQFILLCNELQIPNKSGVLKEVKRLVEGNYQELLEKGKALLEQQEGYLAKRTRRDQLKEEEQTLTNSLADRMEQRKKNAVELQTSKSEGDILKGNIEQLLIRLPEHLVKEEESAQVEIASQLKQKMQKLSEQILKLKEEMKEAKEAYEKAKVTLFGKQTLLQNGTADLKELEKQVGKKKQAFIQILGENSFSSEEDYKRALRTPEEIQAMTLKIKQYEEEVNDLSSAYATLKEQVGEKRVVDVEELRTKLQLLEEKRREVFSVKENTTARVVGNQKALESISDKLASKKRFEEDYGVVKDLDNATRGNNKERLVFEQYVLASYFEDIITAANQRLLAMTGSRYELLKVDRVEDARTTDSLNLEVLDNYTGKKRSVKTLSGGESFKAALSLALGLSDIVQNNAGGIQIETLFIDEGFGSLDSESLDQALDTLTSLTKNNRLIGIISHVDELKERIDNQIVVEKGNHGSTIKLV